MIPPLSRLIFHIGLQKTGTSSLQHFFSRNREQLLKQGILYPKSGSDGKVAHHFLSSLLDPKSKSDQDLSMVWEQLSVERQKIHDTLLFSSEGFQKIESFNLVQEFVSRLKPKQVMIIAYVRECVDFYISSFRQRIQNSSDFLTLSSFFNRPFLLEQRFAGWRSVGDLEVRWYDRKALVREDIIEDISDVIDIERSDLGPAENDMNPSLGGNLLYFRMYANFIGVPFLNYVQMRNLASEQEAFRSAFYVSDRDAARIRATDTYNSYLYEQLGPPPAERSWEQEDRLPKLETLAQDYERVMNVLPGGLHKDVLMPEADISRRWFGVLDD